MNCLEITLQVGCKVRCDYCPQDVLKQSYKGPENKLDFFDFTKYLVDIPTNVKIHFSGMSEPFQNDNLAFYMEWIYKRGHDIGIFTTLLGFSHYCIPILEKIKLDPFSVHIPGKMTEKQISEWCFNFSLAKGFITEIIRVGEFRYDNKIEYLLENTDIPIINQRIISRAGNLDDNYEYKSGKIKCIDDRHKQNVLMPNGDVVLCCMDYGQKHILGNLNDCTYEELFKSDEYKKVLAGFEDDSIDLICRKCFRAVGLK